MKCDHCFRERKGKMTPIQITIRGELYQADICEECLPGVLAVYSEHTGHAATPSIIEVPEDYPR